MDLLSWTDSLPDVASIASVHLAVSSSHRIGSGSIAVGGDLGWLPVCILVQLDMDVITTFEGQHEAAGSVKVSFL